MRFNTRATRRCIEPLDKRDSLLRDYCSRTAPLVKEKAEYRLPQIMEHGTEIFTISNLWDNGRIGEPKFG